MTDPPRVFVERRRHTRISPKGTVILLAGEHVQHGRIGDLSAGGLFTTTLVTAPSRLLGRKIDLELRLDGPIAEWIRASGRVVRITAGGFAVGFDSVSAPLDRLIDDMSAASRTRFRVMSMFLVDSDPRRRSLMAEGFRCVGCTVVECATPLEAIVKLGESSFEPDLIAIADSVPVTVSQELRDFVDSAHPHVKLVAIGDELTEPAGIAHWLSSADPDSDLAMRVRHVLGSPRRRARSGR